MVEGKKLDGLVDRFDGATIAIHWITLLLMAAVFATAWAQAAAEGGEQAAALLSAHRSLGILIWLLTIARLAWRWTRGSHPPLPDSVSRPQRWVARLIQYALYGLLAIQPLTGLAQSLFRGRSFDLSVGTIPALVARNRSLIALFGDLHEQASWLLLVLIGVHALAAIAHRFFFKDHVLQSILPWRQQGALLTNFSGPIGPRQADESLLGVDLDPLRVEEVEQADAVKQLGV